ncbi:hypothetical protein L1987_02606 [Smallanthus sonchifolius]|uniref:Uncharacterized protein n=1 Tax=Smallanthus sonchifolius TaxID=185202 RepID=A0ACB9K8G6_9ASTR|nr:hypothetical protein L1987_02606 [Smallanthus sonchifolius]
MVVEKSTNSYIIRTGKKTRPIHVGPTQMSSRKCRKNSLKLAQPEAVFDTVRDIHDLAGQRRPLADLLMF